MRGLEQAAAVLIALFEPSLMLFVLGSFRSTEFKVFRGYLEGAV